ncbi:MAG: hypothetical protein AAFV54_01730 [Pseudomonadota bacterium]
MSTVYRLPDPLSTDAFIEWELTETGLEWEGGRFGAPWMPFACMRHICVGYVPTLGGWRMRISGPPGAILIAESWPRSKAGDDYFDTFLSLARKVVGEATAVGCGPKLRRNDRPIWPALLWSRLGNVIAAEDDVWSVSHLP